MYMHFYCNALNVRFTVRNKVDVLRQKQQQESECRHVYNLRMTVACAIAYMVTLYIDCVGASSEAPSSCESLTESHMNVDVPCTGSFWVNAPYPVDQHGERIASGA